MNKNKNENGKGVDKKTGEYVHLFGEFVHKIENDINIFKSNRYATDEEILTFKKQKKWQ